MSEAKAELASTMFIELFPKLDERGKRQFTECLQDLYRHSFVIRGGVIKVNQNYAFLEKHEDLISSYLILGGWRLHLDRETGVARIYHPEGSGRVHFNKDETLFILVMRLLYHEQKQLVSDSLEMVLSIGLIREKLHILLPANQVKIFLTKKNLNKILRKLESLRIVNIAQKNFNYDDQTELIVNPSIEYLVSQVSLKEAELKLAELTQQQVIDPDEGSVEEEVEL